MLNVEERPLPEQQLFIDQALHTHAIMVAGPGTGKTWTLSRTAQQIVGLPDVNNDDIALLTLTRSMATSLAQRIPQGNASTLHSFSLSMLNRIGEARRRRVADNWEQENLVRYDIRTGYFHEYGVRLDLRVIDRFLDRLATSFREDQREPTELSIEERQLLGLLNAQREFYRYRLIDELVWDLLRLLEQGQRIAAPPRYILVDEYQDLTAGELRLLHILSTEYGTRIIACGDDRQSIFRFREADPYALHRFCNVYGIAQPIYSSTTRRCPQLICSFAESIAELLPRIEGIDRPQLRPDESNHLHGNIRIYSAKSPIGEAKWVVNNIQEILTGGEYSASDVMVIVAGNKDQVSTCLNEHRNRLEQPLFSFYDPAGVDPLSETKELRLLSAGTQLLRNPEDQLSWRTLVWAAPGLGERRDEGLLTAGQQSYLQNLRLIADRDVAVARVLNTGQSLSQYFNRDENINARDLITHMASGLQLEVNVVTLEPFFTRVGEANLIDNWVRHIFELSLKTQISPSARPADVPIRTIFGAKGLEARVVFLVNAIPQCFSYGGAVNDGIRRLYVAVTRTQDKLYISAPGRLSNTALGHVVGADFGGLFQNILDAANANRITIERPR